MLPKITENAAPFGGRVSDFLYSGIVETIPQRFAKKTQRCAKVFKIEETSKFILLKQNYINFMQRREDAKRGPQEILRSE